MTLYYNCSFHLSMAGEISIVDALVKPAEITFIGDTNITGSLSITGGLDVVNGDLILSGGIIQAAGSGSFFSGSGRGLFDIPQSALSFEINRIASGSATASVSPDFGFKFEGAERAEFSS